MQIDPNDVAWDEKIPTTESVAWDEKTQKQRTRGRTFEEELRRQLGLTLRHGYQGITGSAQLLSDPLVMGFNALTGQNLPLPSNATKQFLDRYLPKPETPMEEGVGALSQMVAGGMDPLMAAGQARVNEMVPKGYAEAQRTAKGDVVQKFRDNEIKLTPGQLEAGTTSRAAAGLSGVPKIQEMERFANAPRIAQMAAEDLGLPKGTQITENVLKDQAKRLVTEGYAPLRAQTEPIRTGGDFHNRLLQLRNEFGGDGSLPAVADEANGLISRYLFDRRLGGVNGMPRPRQSFTASDAIDNIRQLRETARGDFRKGGTDAIMGKVRMGIANALEDSIEQNLTRNPRFVGREELLQNFRAAREGLAKNYAVEEMMVDPSSGVLSTVKAFNQREAGAKLTGKLETIAEAGSPLYRKSTDAPTGGIPAPVSLVEGGIGTMGAGVGLAGGGPVGWAMAGLPGARAGVRHLLMSEPMQNYMARDITGRGLLSKDLAARMKAAGPNALFDPLAGFFGYSRD